MYAKYKLYSVLYLPWYLAGTAAIPRVSRPRPNSPELHNLPRTHPLPRGPTRLTQAYEISKSTGFQMDFWISLGFHVDFWISRGFHVDFWISRVFLDFTISDLFLSSISHYRPIRADLSNEASVIACLRRLNLSSHQNYVAQTLAGRSQPSHS